MGPSVKFWLYLLIAVTLATIAYTAAPTLEERMFPVLGNQGVGFVSRDGNDVRFTAIVTKRRACRPVSVNYQLSARGEIGAMYRIPINVTNVSNPPDSSVSYPAGRAILGPYHVTIPAEGYFAGAVTVFGDIYYRCHPFWVQHQTFGPFAIPAPRG